MNTLCKQESCDKYKRRSYRVDGNPIALARPRFSSGNRVWDSQKDSKFMWQLELGRQHNDEPLFSGPLLLEVVFFMSIPKRKQLDKQPGCAHYLIPDLDNLIKYVCDCLNTIVIKDDAFISEIHSQKVYDTNPRTEITVIQLTTEKKDGKKS